MDQGLSRQRRTMQPPSAKWLTTFNDLITLMMVFFVLVFAMSKGDMVKMREFKSAITRGFGALNGKDVGNIGLINATKPQIITGEKTRKEAVPAAIQKIIEEIGAIPAVATENNENGLVIRISGGILFDSGSSRISPVGYPLLRKIGQLISRVPNRVRVEGHTDNVPISTGAFPSNWELSAARAVNILKFLLNETDIHPRRLSAVGYGASRPIEANDTPENKARNRRVEIFLQKDQG